MWARPDLAPAVPTRDPCSHWSPCSADAPEQHLKPYRLCQLDGEDRGYQLAGSQLLLTRCQVYVPYGSPYTLPVPTTLQPSAVTAAPNVSYPDAAGGLMALSGASTNFALRFSGERAARSVVPDGCHRTV